MEAKSPKKWYQSTITAIASLILLAPIGVFLMWRYSAWKPRTKWILTVISLLFFFSIATTNNKSTTPSKGYLSPSLTKIRNNSTFDVPSLIGKDLNEIEAVLGNGEGITPSAEQIQLGAKTWDKTFKKNGKELLVTYTISDNKVIDFFIGTDDPAGQTKDTEHLLQIGNLNEASDKYSIEFVKVRKDPSYFTGVKITPK